MARRSKFTEDTQKRVLEAIQMGATYELAAGYAGISYETFNEWRRTKAQFSDAVKEAEGKAAMIWLAKIERAASDGNWQAAAWKLERRYPHMYGRTVQEQQGKHELAIKFVNDWRGVGSDGSGGDDDAA